uniref:Uncharacterized protein n=1 Tax=Setaria digitata TaxID=48799 RepID=A0A915Q250_9BILA
MNRFEAVRDESLSLASAAVVIDAGTTIARLDAGCMIVVVVAVVDIVVVVVASFSLNNCYLLPDTAVSEQRVTGRGKAGHGTETMKQTSQPRNQHQNSNSRKAEKNKVKELLEVRYDAKPKAKLEIIKIRAEQEKHEKM